MTVIFAAQNEILALVTAAVEPLGYVVFDGPQPKFPTDKRMVIVGCDDPVTDGMITAVDTGNQDWLDLGAFSKEETFAVFSTLVAWSGASDYTDARSDAQSALNAIEAAVLPKRTGDSLNGASGVLGPTGWSSLSITRVQQIAGPAGSALHVQFVISCTTRLGGTG